jgi:hypothetical protein
MQHELNVSRRSLGRSSPQGSRMNYGTNARCSCKQWSSFTNDKTPSGGGQSWAREAHLAHVALTTVASDIETLNQLITEANRKLVDAISSQDSFALEVYSQVVARLAGQLASDLRKEAVAEQQGESQSSWVEEGERLHQQDEEWMDAQTHPPNIF